MTVGVVTTDPDGSNPAHLSRYGQVGGLRYSHALPRGCITCTFTLDQPVNALPGVFAAGRLVNVYDGPLLVWGGVLGDSDPGPPRQFTGYGLASLGDRYIAVSTGTTPTTDGDTAVDQAIARGLPWRRPLSLPTATLTQGAVGTVNDLLDQLAAANGKRWQVDAYGDLTMAADSTTPDYLLVATTTPGGRAIDNYATALYGRYTDSTTTQPKLVSAGTITDTGAGPLGVFEQVIDLTDRGPLTAAVAGNILAGMLTLTGPRAGFSGTIPVQPGQLLTLGGMPARLSTVTPGAMVRCVGVEPDPNLGELNFDTVVDLTIAETDYDATADLLTLTPVGFEPRDFAAVLEDLYPTRTIDF